MAHYGEQRGVRFWQRRAQKRTLVYAQQFADRDVSPISMSFQHNDIARLSWIRTHLACFLRAVCEGVGMRRKAKIPLESRK